MEGYWPYILSVLAAGTGGLGLGLYRGWKRDQGQKAGASIPDQLSLGLALVDSRDRITWMNEHFRLLVGKKAAPGMEIGRVFPGFSLKEQNENEYIQIYHLPKKVFYIKSLLIMGQEGRQFLLSCEDITAHALSFRRSDNQPVYALLQLDNLEEVLKSVAEGTKPHLYEAVERILREWAAAMDGSINQLGEGRYILFFTQWGFKLAEKNRFAILDRIRDIETGNPFSLTISIGIGINEESISELGRLAQSSLELALDRGGDQVVVKSPDDVRFYGGGSSAAEKRTRVKARAMAYALKDLILQSSQVMIMGHDLADYDSLGSALGIAKAAADLGKKAFVVIDQENSSADLLWELIPREAMAAKLVKSAEAGRKINERTLLVIVDTHKPSLLPNPSLLQKTGQVAVIDHHRRGEEFIDEAKLVYIETYASSTSELVTEMLQYLGEHAALGKFEATALLAGIIVDTKNFMVQTGVRTFEAASYLRGQGADLSAVQKLLRDDIATVVKKAEAIRSARILYGQVALAVSEELVHDAPLLAAKTADTMLNIAGVSASFVLWPAEGGIAVSARSNGEINVQTIMERLGGGGHLTIAAAKVNETLAQTEKLLLDILDEVFRKEA